MSKFPCWLAALFGWLDTHNGAITAIATVFIALFTVTLARASKSQAKLISDQVDLARDQIRLAREEFATTSRAFVFNDGFETVLHTRANVEGPGKYDCGNGQQLDNFLFPGYFSMQPRWKNSGTTETKDMEVSARCEFFDGDPKPDYIFAYDESPRQLFVGGNAVQLSNKIEVGTGSILQVIMLVNGTPLKGGFSQPLLLIWGRADYWDIFGQGHSTEWCYQIRFAVSPEKKLIATFTQYGEYNRAYENQKPRPSGDDPPLPRRRLTP